MRTRTHKHSPRGKPHLLIHVMFSTEQHHSLSKAAPSHCSEKASDGELCLVGFPKQGPSVCSTSPARCTQKQDVDSSAPIPIKALTDVYQFSFPPEPEVQMSRLPPRSALWPHWLSDKLCSAPRGSLQPQGKRPCSHQVPLNTDSSASAFEG